MVKDCTVFQLNAMKQIIENANDLKQAYLNVFSEYRKFITQTPQVEKVLYMARIINDPEIKAITRKFNTEVHTTVTEHVKRGIGEGLIIDDVDPRVLARILMGVVDAMRTMLLVESEEDVESLFIEAVKILEKVNVKV